MIGNSTVMEKIKIIKVSGVKHRQISMIYHYEKESLKRNSGLKLRPIVQSARKRYLRMK